MDQALKQRLVGATVLIILAVILLPMLLSGQPELQSESRRIELPEKPPELSMDKRRFPIGQQNSEQPSRVPEPAASQEPEAALVRNEEPLPVEQAPGNAPERDLQPVENLTNGGTSPAPNPVAAMMDVVPEPVQGRYLVQVASFSNPASVNQISDMLTQLDLPVLLDNVTTDAGRLSRVRVGPFDEVGQAEAAISSILGLNLDLRPRVVDLYPQEDSPVTMPSDPMVRWVVQAGVYSGRANAENMMQQLRNSEFAAFVEEVTSGGNTVFKVKIGPVIERQHADRIDSELEQKMGIDGLVMSVD